MLKPKYHQYFALFVIANVLQAITLSIFFADTNAQPDPDGAPSKTLSGGGRVSPYGYGLGLPRSSNTGGATRGEIPPFILIAPEDGAKTLAPRLTFYIYIASSNPAPTNSSTVPKISEKKTVVKFTFLLRDGNDRSSRLVFKAYGETTEESGLYKFTLPEKSPELIKGKLQRWQIRWDPLSEAGEISAQVEISTPIRRDEDPIVLSKIASTKNDLEKARIYEKNGYWYDAIDAYTGWLSQNPKDDVARNERNNLLKEGLKTHSAFSYGNQSKFAEFLNKINESKDFTTIQLQTQSRK
jgi:hypothetical protein